MNGTNAPATTGLISNTGSPEPFTSYSSSIPFTFARFMAVLQVVSRSRGCSSNHGVRKGVTVGTFAVTALVKGREAASRGDWQLAHELLVEADHGQPLERADFLLLADVVYAAGHLDVTIEVWERAHALALRDGDCLAAAGAAARVAMHLLFDTALMAPVRGWIKRAERLLEDYDDTPVHAWLAAVR